MAKLRTRKWLLSAFASLAGLLAVGLYALAQAPDEGKRDREGGRRRRQVPRAARHARDDPVGLARSRRSRPSSWSTPATPSPSRP